MNEEKIVNSYYQSNIKTSRQEDSVYAMKYASQQMMIYKLQNDKELLKQENQELKLELSGYRQAILEDKDMLGLKEENQELKKQLEELEKENFNLRENIYINKISFSSEGKNIKELIEMPTYEDLINQQKEFIKYLENEITQYGGYKLILYKEILSKFREIIGSDINVGSEGDKE